MDKWKVVIIVVLLGGLAGYGFYQQAMLEQQPAEPKVVTAAPLTDFTKGPMVGEPAPGWNIPANLWMNTPQPVSLQDVKGHVTILEFFRVECPHCEESAPFLRSLYNKYKAQGLRMVAFQSPGDAEIENDWTKVQAVLRRWDLSYPVAFDKNCALLDAYKGESYPTLFVLDKKGIVRFYQTGFSDSDAKTLENYIVKALKG